MAISQRHGHQFSELEELGDRLIPPAIRYR